jgi:hypothetical protein
MFIKFCIFLQHSRTTQKRKSDKNQCTFFQNRKSTRRGSREFRNLKQLSLFSDGSFSVQVSALDSGNHLRFIFGVW